MFVLYSELIIILSVNDFILVILLFFILSSIKYYDILSGVCVCINDKIVGFCR